MMTPPPPLVGTAKRAVSSHPKRHVSLVGMGRRGALPVSVGMQLMNSFDASSKGSGSLLMYLYQLNDGEGDYAHYYQALEFYNHNLKSLIPSYHFNIFKQFWFCEERVILLIHHR